METERRLQGSERYQAIKSILDSALDMATEDRRAFVADACDDEDMQREVESLLASEADMDDDFIAEPIIPRHEDDDELDADRQEIGPYRLLERLGAGGMGVVFLAERQVEFKQKVALKLIMRGLENDEIVGRFRYERQILANLQHPNIARLLDGGTTDDGLPYFVMEYVEGQPISSYCKSLGLSVAKRLDLFRQVCEAVAFAHRNLVVHRDIKPANILVTEDGTPKLLDFGIAKLLNSEGGDLKTGLLRPLTTEYASPEQLAYQNVTTSSDIYTLGVLLYELLTGRRPFAEEETNPQTLLEATRDSLPPPPSHTVGKKNPRLQRRLVGDLDAIVLKALRLEPEARYPSVEKFLDDLDRHRLAMPVLARRGSMAYRVGKFMRRHVARLVIGAVSVGLLCSLVFSVLQVRRTERERLERVRESQIADAYGNFLFKIFEEGNPNESDTVDPALFEATRQILDRALEASEEFMGGDLLQRAVILGALGPIHRSRGDYAMAQKLLEESERLRRQELGNNDPGLVAVLNNLANTYRSQGRYAEAAGKMREALRLVRLDVEATPMKIGSTLNNLAGLEEELGAYDVAVEHFEEAVAIKQELVEAAGDKPPKHLVVSLVLGHSNLGSALHKQGQIETAKKHFYLADTLLAPLEGVEKRRAAWLKNFGVLWREQEDLERATWMLDRSLEIRTREYLPRSQQVVDILLEVALLDQAKGEHAVALEKLQQVLDIQQELYGPEHPEVARTLGHLGVSQRHLGDARAPETLRRASKMLGDFLPEDHPDLRWLDDLRQQAEDEIVIE